MAFPGADERVPGPAVTLVRGWTRGGALRAAAAYRALVRAMEAYPVERLGMAAIAAGLVLRLVAPFFMDLRADGNTYVAMGHAWMHRHDFLMPWGDVTTWGNTGPGHSHHYPPAYPVYLGLVFTAFGYGLWQAKLAAVAVSFAAVAAVYFTTRDLYGPRLAALMGGLVALEPHLLWVTGTGFSENMVLLFFALTMWAILRGLEEERFIVLAGLFAGLCYLSRSSVGYFFFVAGIGGFLWRFHYQRWRLFTNKWYMLAVAVFGAIVLAWAARNVMLFGWREETLTLPLLGTFTLDLPQWQTSSYVDYVQRYAWSHKDLWAHALEKKLPLFLAFGAWYALPLLPETWRGVKRAREEHTSALVLSVFLVWVLAWVISSMFWTYEQSGMYWLDNHRYILIGLVPLGWLVLREARFERPTFRLRYALLALSLFAMCGAALLSPVKFVDARAAEALDPLLAPGDEVAVAGGTIKYAFYAYLSRPEDVTIYGCSLPAPACMGVDDPQPHWIVSLESPDYAGYALVGTYSHTYWNDGVLTGWLLAREDVAVARGLADADKNEPSEA